MGGEASPPPKKKKGGGGVGAGAELKGMENIFATGRLDVGGRLPDVPLAILTSTTDGNADVARGLRDLHAQIAGSVSHSLHLTTNRSGHAIANQRPDLVEDAIKWVIHASREPRPAAKR